MKSDKKYVLRLERTQGQWKSYLQHLLLTNDRALVEALLRIYDRQTAGERQEKRSIYQNNHGFNAVDAPLLSHLARVELNGRKNGRQMVLHSSDMAQLRKRMGKYWKQLMILAKKKQKLKEDEEQANLNGQYGGKLTQEEMIEVQEYLAEIDRQKEYAAYIVSGDYLIPDEAKEVQGYEGY